MKTSRTPAILFLPLFALVCVLPAVCQAATPTITSIRTEGTNLVVTAEVPAGMQRITVEGTERLSRQRWAPRAVVQTQSKGGQVVFRLPISRSMEMLRLRADVTEPLPANFFNGTNSFSAPSDSTAGNGVVTLTPGDGGASTPGGSEVRAVKESDIWQIRGSNLYFFNQYRGLQVIDISNPDRASLCGTVELPAAGDQMYLLEADRVVLLARDSCAYDQSQLVIVDVTNDPPRITARLPIEGYITESRLVGTALYVASETVRPVDGTTNTTYEWGTRVSAFDLAKPDAPVARDSLWYGGYGNVVSATDTYLFVVTQSPKDWWQSVVNVVDITDPTGGMASYGTIAAQGRIADKFKLNYSGAVFAILSEDWHWDGGTRVVTRLETFHLANPRAADPLGLVKLGQLELGHGERLHASRFDSNRVYVVTFFQIDPLWVVDFSNPSAPRIAGSIEVPGWSTFIQPLGNRLVTLGIETNHVSVSLFDVQDPSAPARLSQVKLGANYSWSDANYDEKAFTVLTDAGLILVPFSTDTTNGYTSALQLIDYSPAALKARGQVRSESGLSYRRAAAVKERILSLSDWELVSVDAQDRDNPAVTGRLRLVDSVDRVILAGDFLLRLNPGDGWDYTTPVIGVAAAGAPEVVLNRLQLGSLPLLGATRSGDLLYVAQGTPGWGAVDLPTNNSTLALTVISLTNLPALAVIGEAKTNTPALGWVSDWQAFWPKPGVLVWAGSQGYWGWCGMCPMGGRGGGLIGVADGPVGSGWLPYWGGNGGNGLMFAFDVAAPEVPSLASQVDLNGTNRWGFSKAFLADGLIYVSHQTSQYVPDLTKTNAGSWSYQTFLDVVDFSEPAQPLVREPVNIPNPLKGVSDSGALLFTLGSHWASDADAGWRDYLDASAYDGISAHLVASLTLPAAWPHPVLIYGTNVFLGNPGDYSTNSPPPSIETWTVSVEGKFVLLGSLDATAQVNNLRTFDSLLAVTDSKPGVELFNATDPAKLVSVGSGKPPLCWWWTDLERTDGNLASGVWVPLNAYGLWHVGSKP